ncbi:unnamed protein product [Brugia timori]|uniref:Uncharacterized protein n=1 Tax=Brugia timori TaxID=42155 RepID=A0A3P7WTS5_9BILA|nr:unnamed protein product [Brugia timori]
MQKLSTYTPHLVPSRWVIQLKEMLHSLQHKRHVMAYQRYDI